MRHLYVHFPFCRRKCAYCALFSTAGASADRRAAYSRRVAEEVRALGSELDGLRTVYFGGGSPGWCPLDPVLASLPRGVAEFTVELNPLDVTADLLERLARGGVNRISLGMQSLDDAVLDAMGRGYDARTALAAFRLVRERFPDAGMDFIAGYPAPGAGAGARAAALAPSLELALAERPDHLSVYTLIEEPGTWLAHEARRGRLTLPGDDEALDQMAAAARRVEAAGLARYEISNFARPGRECRYNLAVWRGEDYLGIGPGAHSRIGLERRRVRGEVAAYVAGEDVAERETLSPAADGEERALMRLRLAEGLDLADAPSASAAAWRRTLEFHLGTGLALRLGPDRYRLTERGFEVCDAVLADLLRAAH